MAFNTVGGNSNFYAIPGSPVVWTLISGNQYYTEFTQAIPALGSNRVGVVLYLQHLYSVSSVTSIDSITWDYGGAGQAMTLKTPASVNSLLTVGAYVLGCTQNATVTIRIVATLSGTTQCTCDFVVGWADADSAIAYDNEASGTGTTSGSNPDYYYTVTTSISAAGVVFSGTASEANATVSPYFPDGTVIGQNDSGGNCSISGYSTPSGATSEAHRHDYSQNGQNTAGIGLSFIEGGAPPAAPEIPHPGYPDALPRRPRLAFPTGLTGIKAEVAARRLLRRQRDWLKVAA